MKFIFLLLLMGCVGSTAMAQNVATQLASGKKVFTAHCLTCHMADGQGVQNMNPSLVGSSYVSGDKSKLIQVVLKGLAHQPIDGDNYQNVMPSHAFLSDKEIADVLTFVRASWGNKAVPVSEKEVKGIRVKG